MKMHLNWKVLAGLGAVGVGLFYLVAPNLVVAALPILLLTLCPLSMLLMMKGMQYSQGEDSGQQASHKEEAKTSLTREEHLAQLRREQEALTDRIDMLEQDESRPKKSSREW